MLTRAKCGATSALALIAERLRTDYDSVVQEPLPERWVDLLCTLEADELSRAEHKDAAASASPQSKR